MNKISAYIKSSIDEMKKVSWPTKKQTREYTLMVITISIGVAALLGAFDYIFNLLLQTIINR